MTQVVNLFAGPGAGKSTTAAGLFFRMKAAGIKAELAREYAKELAFSKRYTEMDNALFLLAEQDRRIRELYGKVDYIITDSPLLLTRVYAKGIYKLDWFQQAANGAHNAYDNANFFIKRVKPYQTYGRRQSEESARSVDVAVRALLDAEARDYAVVEGNEDAPRQIMEAICHQHI